MLYLTKLMFECARRAHDDFSSFGTIKPAFTIGRFESSGNSFETALILSQSTSHHLEILQCLCFGISSISLKALKLW